MSTRRAALVVALFASMSGLAFGQAPAPAPPPPPPPYEGTGEFAFVSTTGNASTQTIGLAGDLIMRPSVWTLRAKAAFVQNEAEDVLMARSFAGLFRASRKLSDRVAFYGQYDYLRNLFAGVEHRNALEAGVSYFAIDTDAQKLRLDAGFGYASEQRLTGDDVSGGTISGGLGYQAKLTDTAVFNDDFRLVFSLADGDDWRYENVAAVTAKLSTLLSLKVSNIIRFVNAPALGFEKTDSISSVALVAKF